MANKIKFRIELLKEMHEYLMKKEDDENKYMCWVTLAVPDEPTEEDFEFIAEDDEEFLHCIDLFNRLTKLSANNIARELKNRKEK